MKIQYIIDGIRENLYCKYYNLLDFFNNIQQGVRNIIRWFPIVWSDLDFDYAFLLRIISFKLKLMEHNFYHYGCTVNSKKDAKRMRTVRCLIDRIENDDYVLHPPKHLKGQDSFDHITMLENQDVEYLALLLKKHLRTWWH